MHHNTHQHPREKLTNRRPITLLNTDYKSLAKTMAMRLTTVITKFISNDQCGFNRDRSITTILRTTDDIINYFNNENLPGILVGIDFAKAFDTISKQKTNKKPLIRDSLKIYGFGLEFQRWINTLLASTESAISHYGWIS